MDTTRTFRIQFLQVFLPMAMILAIITAILYRTEVNAITSLVKTDEENKTRVAREIINSQLDSLGADALYLSHQQNLHNWINHGDAADLTATRDDMRQFMTRYQRYDQVRFLNAAGREVIRIDRLPDGRASAVPDARLQDKSPRYYVDALTELQDNQLYISPFDLNLERGRIEQPLKPIIRAGTPVYDNSGHYRGSILLNYLGEQLLGKLRALGTGSDAQQLWLLNDEGYWLLGPAPEQEWGFMWPERAHLRFQQTYPNIWSALNSGGVTAVTASAGLFTHSRLHLTELLPTDQGETWHIIAFTPRQVLDHKLQAPIRQLLVFCIVSLILIIIFAVLIARKEVARLHSEHQLREQESQYRNLLEGAPDAIIIVNQDGDIRLVNTEAEKLFGYDRDELIGKPVETLVPERFDRHRQYQQGYIQHPTVRPMGQSQELFAKCKSGRELPVEISLSPFIQGDEKLITAVIRDVSVRKERDYWIKELNKKLVARTTALEATNKELESFSYSVSHDLRAPLRAVDGFSKTVLKDYGGQLDERGQDRLERIRAAAQRMGQLIDDLLTLSRITRFDVNRQPVDITEMAEHIVNDLRRAEPERRVTTDIQPGMTARADPRLLAIALTNLLSNAWKFTAKIKDAHIIISCEEEKNEKTFIIKDNGAGFNIAYAGKLFGAFQRLHNAGDFEGTGIGLATTQRVIHKHGGRIWADSEEGKGATFYFTLGQE